VRVCEPVKPPALVFSRVRVMGTVSSAVRVISLSIISVISVAPIAAMASVRLSL
jgi:hypothetical protein